MNGTCTFINVTEADSGAFSIAATGAAKIEMAMSAQSSILGRRNF
jgi:hypothetical protein